MLQYAGDTVHEGGARVMHAGRRRRGAKQAQVAQRGRDPDGVVPPHEVEEERAEPRQWHTPEEGRGGLGEQGSILSQLRARRGSAGRAQRLVRGPQRGAVPERSSLGGGRDLMECEPSGAHAPVATSEKQSSAGLQYLDGLGGGSTEPVGQGRSASQQDSQGQGKSLRPGSLLI